eukprot:6666806-Prorocentrum_lima.AAC.1
MSKGELLSHNSRSRWDADTLSWGGVLFERLSNGASSKLNQRRGIACSSFAEDAAACGCFADDSSSGS